MKYSWVWKKESITVLRYINAVVDTLLIANAHRAVKYISEKEIIRATRRLVRGKVPNSKSIEVILTIGRPNYSERKFIKECKRVKEPFPVRKIQLKYPPKRRV